MSGVISVVAWAETGDELYARYRTSTDVRARKRLHVLWLVRCGTSAREAARQAGVGERTAVRWLGWYRAGGLTAVLERVPGHGALGRAGQLTEEQKWALAQESAQGRFRTYDEARSWVQEHYGVGYGYKATKGSTACCAAWGCDPKCRVRRRRKLIPPPKRRGKGGLYARLERGGRHRPAGGILRR